MNRYSSVTKQKKTEVDFVEQRKQKTEIDCLEIIKNKFVTMFGLIFL